MLLLPSHPEGHKDAQNEVTLFTLKCSMNIFMNLLNEFNSSILSAVMPL